jgi:hypothetical protein
VFLPPGAGGTTAHKEKPTVSSESQREAKRLRMQELQRQMKLAGKNAGEFKGRLEDIPANKLQKSEFYQRPFQQNRAIDIALAFDPIAFHALSVARRPDGSLYFMDGQHRLMAAMLAKGDRYPVPCMVYDVEDERTEAWVYNRINIDRRGLSAADKWKSRHAEGDAYVLEVEDLLGEYGLVAAPKRGSYHPVPGEVVATNTLEMMLKKAGAQSVREVLGTLSSTFGDNPLGYREHFLRGVWHFIIRYPQHNPQRLRTVLLRKGVEWTPLYANMDPGISMAVTVHQAYNHNEAPQHRMPPFPLTPKGNQSGSETNRAALEYRKARGDMEGGQRGGNVPKK